MLWQSPTQGHSLQNEEISVRSDPEVSKDLFSKIWCGSLVSSTSRGKEDQMLYSSKSCRQRLAGSAGRQAQNQGRIRVSAL